MSKYYYHGITDNTKGLSVMYGIFKEGAIKCRKHLWKEQYKPYGGYNGIYYVSVCQKLEEGVSGEQAYRWFIQNRFCLILEENLPAIKTITLGSHLSIEQHLKLLKEVSSLSENRCSDLVDEWQVKGDIPLSSVVGIGLPVRQIFRDGLVKQRKDFYRLLKIIKMAHSLHIDIVDSSQPNFAERYESRTDKRARKVKKYE